MERLKAEENQIQTSRQYWIPSLRNDRFGLTFTWNNQIPVTCQFLPNFHFENFVFETKEDCIYYVKKTFDIYMRFCILDGSLDLNDSDIVATHRV